MISSMVRTKSSSMTLNDLICYAVICDSASGQDDTNIEWCDFNSTSSGDWLDPGDETSNSPAE